MFSEKDGMKAFLESIYNQGMSGKVSEYMTTDTVKIDAQASIVDLAENLLGALDSYGLDQDSKHFDKDFSFAMEAFRALIYRTLSINHHLHDFIETSVSLLKKDENGNLIIESPEDMEEIIIAEIDLSNPDDETIDTKR